MHWTRFKIVGYAVSSFVAGFTEILKTIRLNLDPDHVPGPGMMVNEFFFKLKMRGQ